VLRTNPSHFLSMCCRLVARYVWGVAACVLDIQKLLTKMEELCVWALEFVEENATLGGNNCVSCCVDNVETHNGAC
jgi:hypothetical protein